MPRAEPPLRVLMVHWDGAGNQPPQRALARELVRRGHEVHVLSHDSVGNRARSDGAIFHSLGTARQYSDSDHIGDGLGELKAIADICWLSPAYANDFLTVARAIAPDIMLIDNTLISVQAVAADLDIPTAVMAHNIYAPETTDGMFAMIASPGATALFERAKAFVAAQSLIVVPSYAAFNPIADRGPAVRHVGPIREPVEAASWPRRFPDRPFVLVSLSTSFQNQAETLQRICDGLARLDVEALVTTGPNMRPELFTVCDHVELRDFVSHDEILPSADLVITHCGHGTVMAAAGAGVPMVCLPMGRDQPFVASRVEALGLGRSLAYTSSPEEIAAGAAEILAEPTWKLAATRFAAGVPRFGELGRAADLVEQTA